MLLERVTRQIDLRSPQPRVLVMNLGPKREAAESPQSGEKTCRNLFWTIRTELSECNVIENEFQPQQRTKALVTAFVLGCSACGGSQRGGVASHECAGLSCSSLEVCGENEMYHCHAYGTCSKNYLKGKCELHALMTLEKWCCTQHVCTWYISDCRMPTPIMLRLSCFKQLGCMQGTGNEHALTTWTAPTGFLCSVQDSGASRKRRNLWDTPASHLLPPYLLVRVFTATCMNIVALWAHLVVHNLKVMRATCVHRTDFLVFFLCRHL